MMHHAAAYDKITKMHIKTFYRRIQIIIETLFTIL